MQQNNQQDIWTKIFLLEKDLLENQKYLNKVESSYIEVVRKIDSIKEEYGIHPHNFINYRILDGDKSDGISGIKGCGIKTIIKTFPIITEETKHSVDDMISFANTNKDNHKIYTEILHNKDVVERNYNLMQLTDPDISGQVKLKINDKFDIKNIS